VIEASRSRSFLHRTLSRTPPTEWSSWQYTTLTRDRHPCPRRDWNPQSQQGTGRRLTHHTAWLPGSAKRWLNLLTNVGWFLSWMNTPIRLVW
jgi:hypothetical protein